MQSSARWSEPPPVQISFGADFSRAGAALLSRQSSFGVASKIPWQPHRPGPSCELLLNRIGIPGRRCETRRAQIVEKAVCAFERPPARAWLFSSVNAAADAFKIVQLIRNHATPETGMREHDPHAAAAAQCVELTQIRARVGIVTFAVHRVVDSRSRSEARSSETPVSLRRTRKWCPQVLDGRE